MITSIHPYKGYLNTQFRVFVKGEQPLRYKVYATNWQDDLVQEGCVEPNQPCYITMPIAGEFIIRFEDGSKHIFRVEDGYRYGGNKLKNTFIFDDCPWIFVIMRDRTYFYNRETQDAYVESISPDEIDEISSDFVLFKSTKHDELTLFSLELQKPVLWIDNIIFHTNKVICWEEKDVNTSDTNLIFYSLLEQRVIKRLVCGKYSFDARTNSLFYYSKAVIHRVDIDSFADNIIYQYNGKQEFVTFVNIHYAISVETDQSKLYLFDIQNSEDRGVVEYQGSLARINDVLFIDINSEVDKYRDPDCDAATHTLFTEIDFYPCDWKLDETLFCKWRTFYAEKHTHIYIYKYETSNSVSQKQETIIKSIEANISKPINNIKGTVITNENYFHFFNSSESLVIPRIYPSSISYHKDRHFMQVGEKVIMESDDEIRFVTNRGFWDGRLIGNFDISYLDTFGVLRNKKNNKCYNLIGKELGVLYHSYYTPALHLWVGDYCIYPGGEYISVLGSPQFISPQGQFGLSISEREVTLYEINSHKVTKTSRIMQEIFETNNYANVLLGENGRQVIFRDNRQSKMLDLASGAISEFENLSFINHINGIRPFFRLSETSQAILINPIDGQPINFNLLSDYQFVSPDYQLYADKALNKYIEYYDLIQQRVLSIEEYQEVCKKFGLLNLDKPQRKKVVQNRKDFVLKHSDFLIGVLRKRGYLNRPIEEFQTLIIELETIVFLHLFIEKRGVAVIKRISDDFEIARVPLGPPLWFLNYVSFSKDSRYVAIAGRYPNGSCYGGLFLVYDIENCKTVIASKSSYAVWMTAFTKNDVVAAYTSTPNSFIGRVYEYNPNEIDEDKYKKDKGFNIRDFNFLTFSPDGKFFACSQQGYLCYNKPDGTVRSNWGHQPSSLVSIRSVDNPQYELLAFYDLSDEGIADTNVNQSVASVSFSNDNKRIMMVGRNGVVVVRNINL